MMFAAQVKLSIVPVTTNPSGRLLDLAKNPGRSQSEGFLTSVRERSKALEAGGLTSVLSASSQYDHLFRGRVINLLGGTPVKPPSSVAEPFLTRAYLVAYVIRTRIPYSFQR